MQTRLRDRTEAGQALAGRLSHLRGEDVIVLALPRGGVPVAAAIARELDAPLDVLNVRKLGVPWHDELAMGAIATGGVRVLNNDVIFGTGVSAEDLEEVTRLQSIELARRETLYRGGRAAPILTGKTVVVVDDGIATGATVRAAISVLKSQNPARVVLATPVAQASVAATLARQVDELVVLLTPEDLYAIGVWYEHFDQLTDDEVRAVLADAGEGAPHRAGDGAERQPVS